ncbi:MAG: hypothetical protein RR410_04840 [Alistipes sp.]
MSQTLRYWGEFRSVKGDLYRVEILREDGGVQVTPERIGFAYDEPAEIEWSEVDKLEPVQGSCLTLTLDSDTDRRFLNLYTVEVGTIRADVYRNGLLYWSGLLDPELYEEPFSQKQDYDVSILFSDFAILDRKMWEGKGILSIRQVIDNCLKAAGFKYTDLVQHISTKLSANAIEVLTLDEVQIIGENFYDEEDEPMTMREVLEEVLRPFALRIVQKNGRIYIYDLNAIHTLATQRVVWSDVDASLEADCLYNNVKVTFSPYADGQLIDGSLDYDDILPNQPVGSSGELIRTDRKAESPEGFRIVCGTPREQVDTLAVGGGAVLFRIDPEYSGSKEAGVMWGYRPENDWRFNVATKPEIIDNSIFQAQTIIKTRRQYIGMVPHPQNYRIKVTMEVLFDVRYNPFESLARENEEGNWDRLQNWCNYGYVPIDLTLCNKEGKSLYSYFNNNIRCSSNYTNSNCLWYKDAMPSEIYNHSGHAWLCFYDTNNRKSASGFGGWQTNKPIIGWYADGLPSTFTHLNNGEYLPLPPINGYLEMKVYDGVHQFDNDSSGHIKDIWSRIRWLMYKNPKVEIVKANGRDIDKEDVEDVAWLNKSAKENLEINTIFGTMPDPVPSARGLLLKTDGSVHIEFSRAGHTDRLERLLIGTAYSQYAARKHLLTGTAEIIPTFTTLTDASEPGHYLLLAEVQHLLSDEGEIKMVQFSADDYESIEYK